LRYNLQALPSQGTSDQEMEGQAFYTEDVCTLKSAQGKNIGIIGRTTNDVDTHTPHPERDYDNLKCHKDISAAEFARFKRTGIPPLGTVLVEWQTLRSSQLIPTKHLLLIDRALLVGDIVKRHVEDSMSGTVVETLVTCTLNPVAALRGMDQIDRIDPYAHHDFHPERLLFDIPADEIKPANDYPEGGIVIYKDWVGRIEEVFDEVTIRLPNQSIVKVENADELSMIYRPTGRFEVGDIVKTTKRNLKGGEWIIGAYDILVPPIGDVVKVQPVRKPKIKSLFHLLLTFKP
jgi:ubiquitin-conjugating enzyme E2 O